MELFALSDYKSMRFKPSLPLQTDGMTQHSICYVIKRMRQFNASKVVDKYLLIPSINMLPICLLEPSDVPHFEASDEVMW